MLMMLVLAGCATSYGPRGVAGGYADRQLDERTWIISANGNEFTSAERVKDIALLRAAEIGRERGFSHFLLAYEYSTQDISSYTTPQTNNAYAGCHEVSCYANSYASGGQAFPSIKHGSRIKVVYLEKGVDEIPLDAVSVSRLWNQLAPRYLDWTDRKKGSPPGNRQLQ